MIKHNFMVLNEAGAAGCIKPYTVANDSKLPVSPVDPIETPKPESVAKEEDEELNSVIVDIVEVKEVTSPTPMDKDDNEDAELNSDIVEISSLQSDDNTLHEEINNLDTNIITGMPTTTGLGDESTKFSTVTPDDLIHESEELNAENVKELAPEVEYSVDGNDQSKSVNSNGEQVVDVTTTGADPLTESNVMREDSSDGTTSTYTVGSHTDDNVVDSTVDFDANLKTNMYSKLPNSDDSVLPIKELPVTIHEDTMTMANLSEIAPGTSGGQIVAQSNQPEGVGSVLDKQSVNKIADSDGTTVTEKTMLESAYELTFEVLSESVEDAQAVVANQQVKLDELRTKMKTAAPNELHALSKMIQRVEAHIALNKRKIVVETVKKS